MIVNLPGHTDMPPAKTGADDKIKILNDSRNIEDFKEFKEYRKKLNELQIQRTRIINNAKKSYEKEKELRKQQHSIYLRIKYLNMTPSQRKYHDQQLEKARAKNELLRASIKAQRKAGIKGDGFGMPISF